MSQLSPATLELLRQSPLFANLGPDEEACLRDGEEVTLESESVLASEGEKVNHFVVLLEGEVRIAKHYGEQDVLLATVLPGQFFGEILLLLDMPSVAQVTATKRSRIVRFDRDAFFRLLRSCEPAANTILREMAKRLRNKENFDAQREKLASLGTMAAGMAHELNNPISAARRAIGGLSDAIKHWRELSLEVSLESAADGCWTSMLEMERATVLRARGAVPLDPIAQTDREDELTRWMESNGVAEPWKLAPTFASAGLDVAWLDSLRTTLPDDATICVLPWFEAGLAVDAMLREADDSTDRVSGLVRSIKSYTHMDRTPRQEMDLHEGIENTLKMLGHKTKGTTIIKEFDPTLPKIVGYPGELNQVWTNLIANAGESLGGKGTIRIRTLHEDAGHVTITIGDDGPGIPADLKERLFEPFFTTKPVGQGTGMGLVISHRIVADRHGGEIEVESKPGDTRFLVRLPLVAPSEKKSNGAA
jgi:signal transduction histidine kinase